MKLASTRLPLIILAFLCLNNYTASAADPLFKLNGGNVCKDAAVEVDITLADFTEIIGFQFTVGWSPMVMQINEVININPIIADVVFGNIDAENSALTVSWFDNDIIGKTIADNEILFTISYLVVGDNAAVSMLTFLDDPTPSEVYAMNGNGEVVIIDGIWTEGMITIDEPELALVEVTNDINMAGVGGVDITITSGTAPYSFFWNNGETTEDLVNVPMGTYNCTVTDNKNCVTEVGPFTVDNVVGNREIQGLAYLQLYPNPASTKLNINAQLENPQAVEVNIFNILGEKVYFEQTESANIDLDLDLSDLAIGSYIVQLRVKDGMHVQKLQIHR